MLQQLLSRASPALQPKCRRILTASDRWAPVVGGLCFHSNFQRSPLSQAESRARNCTLIHRANLGQQAWLRNSLQSTPSPRTSAGLKWDIANLQRGGSAFYTTERQTSDNNDSEADQEEVNPFPEYNEVTYLKPIAFTAAVIVGSFWIGSAARAENRWEGYEVQYSSLKDQILGFIGDSFAQRADDKSTAPIIAGPWIENLPEVARRIVLMAESSIREASPGQQVAYAIMGINVAVFALWQIPRLTPFMRRHFMHHPLSGKTYTMMTAAFSHRTLLHLCFNMLALKSFVPILQEDILTCREEFLAVYISAAAFASLCSHLISTAVLRRFQMVRPTLGASGALWAVLVGVGFALPDLPVSIIFLPFTSFKLGQVLPALAALDVIGLIRRWKVFDHSAHLGGALAGAIYMKWGGPWWDETQRQLDLARQRNP
ncbi:uncharacterized protein BJ171DRAFT_505887 [Polychytrium aggregatum]|uniref:uncharacterized protein n=1 Tax=Polychytrium aggregatum TaxID=110093 RepID=UPI0022FE01FA|nr:uncharacterized protein BJ171DRAFT_505887 [Polychytrium aggregatum]KAI9204464.1 hypothetical protein BJ171DRAFT_505887 [Polychytrium aggregatum]